MILYIYEYDNIWIILGHLNVIFIDQIVYEVWLAKPFRCCPLQYYWTRMADTYRMAFPTLNWEPADAYLKTVQERLGHSRIDMTLYTYSHIVSRMQQEAIDQLDKLLNVGKL